MDLMVVHQSGTYHRTGTVTTTSRYHLYCLLDTFTFNRFTNRFNRFTFV